MFSFSVLCRGMEKGVDGTEMIISTTLMQSTNTEIQTISHHTVIYNTHIHT